MKILFLVLKGMAMGAANVIPGVSGGTIAFITGIYERLIAALGHFDLISVKLVFKGKWRDVVERVDLWFLVWLFLGVAISILSLAKVLEWALLNHEILTMAFFFGLIVASIIGVGKQIENLTISTITSFVVGSGIAIMLAFLTPASSNEAFFYVVLCGVAAVSSMILPGLSGAYVLLLMGNYLLALNAISTLNVSFILPLLLGAVIGLIFLSKLLSYLFQKNKDVTIALLTGFVAGSLLIIWPWKNTIMGSFGDKQKAIGYEWLLPEFGIQFAVAIGLMIVGFLLVWIMDKFSAKG